MPTLVLLKPPHMLSKVHLPFLKSLEYLHQSVCNLIYHFMVVVVKRHFYIQTNKLSQVSVCIGIFGSEYCKRVQILNCNFFFNETSKTILFAACKITHTINHIGLASFCHRTRPTTLGTFEIFSSLFMLFCQRLITSFKYLYTAF